MYLNEEDDFMRPTPSSESSKSSGDPGDEVHVATPEISVDELKSLQIPANVPANWEE